MANFKGVRKVADSHSQYDKTQVILKGEGSEEYRASILDSGNLCIEDIDDEDICFVLNREAARAWANRILMYADTGSLDGTPPPLNQSRPTRSHDGSGMIE